MINYGNYEDFRNNLIGKTIVEWAPNYLKLSDGTVVTIEESEHDCCASAGGSFSTVKLEAIITEVSLIDITGTTIYGETTNEAVITIFHNQNIIAQADAYANDGNGGYYYSVASFVIKDIHYKIVEA